MRNHAERLTHLIPRTGSKITIVGPTQPPIFPVLLLLRYRVNAVGEVTKKKKRNDSDDEDWEELEVDQSLGRDRTGCI